MGMGSGMAMGMGMGMGNGESTGMGMGTRMRMRDTHGHARAGDIGWRHSPLLTFLSWQETRMLATLVSTPGRVAQRLAAALQEGKVEPDQAEFLDGMLKVCSRCAQGVLKVCMQMCS